MTTAKPVDVPPVAASPAARPPLTWRSLVTGSAVASAVTFLAAAAALGDLEAAAYGIAYAVGAVLVRWRGRLGAAVLGLANANVLVWMSVGALSNVTGGQRVVFVLVPALLAGFALTGVVAAIAVLVRPRAPAGQAPLAVAAVATVVVAAVAIAALVTADGRDETDDVLSVTSDNVLFTESQLTAPAGEVTVRMANGDLFWHTFTIDEFGVDLWVPVGGERDVTFDAPAGTYTYYCRIPGHEARMRGELVVE